jgi:hypothetical protein
MTEEPYSAIHVFNHVVKVILFQKLSGKQRYGMVGWDSLCRSLEPDLEIPELYDKSYREFKDQFQLNVNVGLNELRRSGLVYNTFGKDSLFISLGMGMGERIKMPKTELEAWAEERIYQCCPWLRPGYAD